ncbi:MAG: phosphotransferase [Porticoccaceae bacterium]
MTNTSARLMRAISEELAQKIIPELQSADAIERARLSIGVLQNLAADLDVLTEVATKLVPEYRAAIQAALDNLPAAIAPDQAATWNQAYTAIASEEDIARQREVARLRALGAEIVRRVADLGDATAEDKSRAQDIALRLGEVDFRWLTAYDKAKAAVGEQKAPADEEGDSAAADENKDFTAQMVTEYLRGRYPGSPEITCSEVIPIPGGRSKKTFFLSIAGASELPAQLVMRQDFDLRYEGTKVKDEYVPLAALAKLDLPVPRPLLLETETTALGGPFLFVDKKNGSPPGSYFGLAVSCPGAFRDLAKNLAKLHQADPAELGLDTNVEPSQALMNLIDFYENKWRSNSTMPSPLVDYSLSWARQQCLLDEGSLAPIHGDAGPYNFLVENDRLSAILDWEFLHLGDPAEDLGVARFYAEDVMPWQEFLDIYHAEGGPQVPERRVQLAMLLQFIKGATLVATSARNYEEGWTREFVKGANSFAGMRVIELRIASLLQRFNAV